MNLMTIRRRRAANKGFNLIEAAIVLGIVGLVVGGIWVAATSVYANLRAKTATDQLLKVAQGVRSIYATSANMANTAGDVTSDMAKANVLPGDNLTGLPSAATAANTVNPWNGNLGVIASDAAGALLATNATNFGVVFTNVPSAACVDFVLRNAGSSHDTGMIFVEGGATGVASTLPTTTVTGLTVGNAITLTQAQTICDSTGGTVRKVAFVFSLRG